MKKGMLQWYILFAAILLVPLFMLATAPYAFGCDLSYASSTVQCVPLAQDADAASPTDTSTPTATVTDTSTATVTPTATVTDTLIATDTPTITPTATPRPTWTPFPTPVGDNPNTARNPLWVKPEYCIEAMCPGAVNAPVLNSPGHWDWIVANSSVWYKMDDGHSLQLEIWVFANGQSGLSLDVYAPEQTDLYGKPVGRGALNKNYPGADLFYSGRSSAYGIWYARLTNNNSVPTSYSFRFTRTTPTGDACSSCHKTIGYDWNACSDPAFCQQLHDYANTNPTCYNHDINADLAGGCQ